MKFAEHLSAHITPEWRKQYINYEVCIVLFVHFHTDVFRGYEIIHHAFNLNTFHIHLAKKNLEDIWKLSLSIYYPKNV